MFTSYSSIDKQAIIISPAYTNTTSKSNEYTEIKLIVNLKDFVGFWIENTFLDYFSIESFQYSMEIYRSFNFFFFFHSNIKLKISASSKTNIPFVFIYTDLNQTHSLSNNSIELSISPFSIACIKVLPTGQKVSIHLSTTEHNQIPEKTIKIYKIENQEDFYYLENKAIEVNLKDIWR